MHDQTGTTTKLAEDPTPPPSRTGMYPAARSPRPMVWLASMAILLLVVVTGVAVFIAATSYMAENDALNETKVVRLQLEASEKQRVQLNADVEREEGRTAESNMVLSFLRQTLTAPERPDSPKDATILWALHGATDKLDQESSEFPTTVEIEIRDAIAGGFEALGELDSAETQYTKTLELRQSALGETHPAALATMNRLRLVILEKGEKHRADELRDELVRSFATLKAEQVPGRVPRLYGLAQSLADAGQLGNAVPELRRVLRVLHNFFPDGHPHIAEGLQRLAPALLAIGEEDEAIASAADAMEQVEAIVPEAHPDLASALAVLSSTLIDAERFDEAETHLRRCLKIRRAVLDEGHWLTHNSASMLGEVLTKLERFDDAEALLIPAYESLRQHPDAPNNRRREARLRIVNLYEAWGRPDAADPYRK